MDFDEAGRQYAILKNQLEREDILEHEFLQLVEKIQVVAPDHKTWRIDPQTGNWVEGVKGQTPPFLGKPEEKPPESILQLLFFLAKGLLKNSPRLIMTGLLMAVLTWIAHTYLIAKVNEGLMYQAGKVAVNSVVHLRETHFPGINAFWGLLAYFLSSFFMRARAQGIKNWGKDILGLPKNIKEAVKKNQGKSVRFMVFGAFSALVFIFLYKNFMLGWVLAFGVLLITTAHLSSLEILVLRACLLDLQKLTRRKFVKEGEQYPAIFLFLVGSFVGFVLAGIWRTQFTYTLISALVLLLFYIYISRKGFSRLAALFILSLGGFLLLETPVFAWCEGGSLSQAGGNWLTWWGSRNADVVRRLGLIPAGFSFAGGVLGSSTALLPTGNLVPPETGQSQESTLPPSGGTRILDGMDAQRWLESQGLLANGILTERFWNGWYSYLGGGTGKPYGLGAVAGDWNPGDRNQPVGDIAIVVEEPPQAPEPGAEIPETPVSPDKDPEIMPPEDNKLTPPDVDAGEKTVVPGSETREGQDPPPPLERDKGPQAGGGGKTPPTEIRKEPEVAPAGGGGKGPKRDEYGMPAGIKPVDYFQDLMTQVLEQMRTRHWVMNPDLRDSWLARLGHGNPSLIVKLLNNYALNPLAQRLTDWEGGQCGEFAGWGKDYSGNFIRTTFGRGAFVDEIILERNPLINHAATKVILPNGERYVLDFWEGMQEGAPRVYTEQDWINKWKNQLGGNPKIEHLGYLETRLKNLVEILGDPEEAIEMFLDDSNTPLTRTIAESYRRNPW